MKKQDWLTSCAVATVVALTVALAGPKMGFADPTSLVTVPSLPSTSMTIPTINAEVAATATADPGKAVLVHVTVKSPSGAGVTEVPVTLTASSTTNYPMSRSMPMPVQLAQVNETVAIGEDGCGTADVELPLTWETPVVAQAQKPENMPQELQMKATTSYQLALSSSLGSKAAPAMLQGRIASSQSNNNIGQMLSNSVQRLVSF